MKNRETELDILRLLAALGVIFTHASGIDEGSGADLVFLTATVTWHVPVFVMLSGRFFLDPGREMPVEKLLKSIARLISAFLFWNLVYQIYYILTGTYDSLNWKGILSQALVGPYHFWYLYMLVGLYAITPFLRKITESRVLSRYFLLLFLIFSFLTGYGVQLPLIGSTLQEIVTKTNFHFALGYSGYFVLGYYLRCYPPKGWREPVLYALGILMLLATGLGTVWKSRMGAEGEEWFSKYLLPNVIVEAAALYTFFVKRISKLQFREKTAALLATLSRYSFGTYLLHALVLELLSISGIFRNAQIPGVAIAAAVLLAYGISTALTALIQRIPVVGKKIT